MVAKQTALISDDVGQGHHKDARKAQQLGQHLVQIGAVDEMVTEPSTVGPNLVGEEHQEEPEFFVEPTGRFHDAWFKFQRDKIAAFGAFHLSIFLWNTEVLSALATMNDGSDHDVASKREYLSCTGGKQRILE